MDGQKAEDTERKGLMTYEARYYARYDCVMEFGEDCVLTKFDMLKLARMNGFSSKATEHITSTIRA